MTHHAWVTPILTAQFTCCDVIRGICRLVRDRKGNVTALESIPYMRFYKNCIYSHDEKFGQFIPYGPTLDDLKGYSSLPKYIRARKASHGSFNSDIIRWKRTGDASAVGVGEKLAIYDDELPKDVNEKKVKHTVSKKMKLSPKALKMAQKRQQATGDCKFASYEMNKLAIM